MNHKIIKFTDLATFPCRQNTKLPATQHGMLEARKGVKVEEFIKRGYNIGVACATSGLIALDLDYHNQNANPAEELMMLEKQLKTELPSTLIQASASGNGRHFIFSSNGIVTPRGKLTPNIDIRYNAYIMFAPSVINGRKYEIIAGVDNGGYYISDLPQPWLDYINKAESTQDMKQTRKSYSSTPKTLSNINIGAMFDNCAFLAYCRDNAAILTEPEWFSMVSVLATIEGTDDLIHELSMPYLKYNFRETQKKIDNARKFGMGHSCSYISGCFPEICGNCSYRKGGC